MAPFGRHGRGLHAARAAARDQDLAPVLGRLARAIGQLAPGLRALNAGDGIAHDQVADTGLVAADAGADVVEPAGGCLVRHLRVADHGPGHAAHVGLAAGDHLLGDLGLVDAPGHQHGLGDLGLDRRREGCGIACLEGHLRHHVDDPRHALHGAGGDVEVVEQPIRIDGLADLDDLVRLHAVVLLLVAADAHAEDEVAGDPGAHGGDDLAQKTHPVLEAAAVFVVAPVHAGIEELRRQQAVAGQQLDPVQPGLLHAQGCGGVVIDDVGDLRVAHGARHVVGPFARQGRGAVGDRPAAVQRRIIVPAAMAHLAEHLGAVRVHGLDDAAVAGNAFVRE